MFYPSISSLEAIPGHSVSCFYSSHVWQHVKERNTQSGFVAVVIMAFGTVLIVLMILIPISEHHLVMTLSERGTENFKITNNLRNVRHVR